MIAAVMAGIERHAFLRYSLVGLFCVILNLAIQIGAIALLELHYAIANLLSFLILVPLSFVLQRRVTFRVDYSHWMTDFFRYLMQWLAVLCLNLALMAIFVDVAGLNSLAAILIVTGLLYLINFLGQRHWVFRRR